MQTTPRPIPDTPAPYSRMRRLKFLALCVLIVLLLSPWTKPGPDGCGISVMTWNVGNARRPAPTVEQVADVIRGEGRPDILLLQETRDTEFLRALAARLGYAHVAPRPEQKSRGADTAILSDFPLTPDKHLRWPVTPFTGAAILAQAATPLGPILLGSVHLPAMRKERDGDHNVVLLTRQTLQILWRELTEDTNRGMAARELMNATASWSGRIVLGGDFNTLAWAKALRPVQASLHDALWPGWSMFSGTYVLVDSWLRPRIDFLFHDPGLRARQGDVGRHSPGDHLPVRTIVDLSSR